MAIDVFSEVRDYCQFESFNASCPSDSVVVMETAQYGRMRFGRCVDRDYGYVGCSANVLQQADTRLVVAKQQQVALGQFGSALRFIII